MIPVRLLACFLIVLAFPALAADGETSGFARVTDEEDRPHALQLAVVSYAPADSNIRVDLVSAVHVADEAFYEELNERFRDYDAVLYELVAPEGTVITPETELKGFLTAAQRAIKYILDLSFQLEEIDYTPPNFVHADLSPDEMSASMAERGESLYTYFWQVLSASMREMGRDPLGLEGMKRMDAVAAADGGNALKVMIAYDFADSRRHRHMFGIDADTAIVGARNQRAIDVMQREIDGGAARVAVFYGLAHMPDLEERLVALGYERVAVTWLDAWLL